MELTTTKIDNVVCQIDKSLEFQFSEQYFIWNKLLFNAFFSKQNEGKTVLLTIDKLLIEQLEKEYTQQPLESYFDTIHKEVRFEGCYCQISSCKLNINDYLVESATLIEKCISLDRFFKEHNFSIVPPTIGFLCLFVLPTGENMSTVRYYKPLNTYLRNDSSNMPKKFGQIRSVWESLEKFTDLNNEKYGRFSTKLALLNPKFININIPVSQTLLKPTEKLLIHHIFNENAITSDSNPKLEYLAHIILKSKFASKLRRSIIRVLKNREDELRNAFLKIVYEELLSWDGELQESIGTNITKFTGSLHICLKPIEDTIELAYFRIRLNNELNLDGGVVKFNGISLYFTIDKYPWTEYLTTKSQEPFKPPLNKIYDDLEFTSKKFSAKLNKTSCHIFIKKRYESGNVQDEYVNSQNLELDEVNLLLFNITNKYILGWLDEASNYEEQKEIASHPFGEKNRLVYVKNPEIDFDGKTELHSVDNTSIVVVGGIKPPNSKNSFFEDFKPKIKVPSSNGYVVYCKGLHCEEHIADICEEKILNYDKSEKLYVFPKSKVIKFPQNTLLKIQIYERNLNETSILKSLIEENLVGERTIKFVRYDFKTPPRKIKRDEYGAFKSVEETIPQQNTFSIPSILEKLQLYFKKPYIFNNHLHFFGINPGEEHEFYYKIDDFSTFKNSKKKIPRWKIYWIIVLQKKPKVVYFEAFCEQNYKATLNALSLVDYKKYPQNLKTRGWSKKIIKFNKKMIGCESQHKNPTIRELWTKTVNVASEYLNPRK